MDEDSLPTPPPPFVTENSITNDNHDDILPYFLNSALLFPSTSHTNQYYPTDYSLPTQNSQFAMDNIDWISSVLNGKPMVNGDQMAPSVLTSRNNTSNIGSEGGDSQDIRINKRKSAGKTKKSVPPRVAFHTRSSEDILDDGYKWRKYGQKSVKHSKQPRSYYRCTHHTCNVKKQIQRLSKDNSVVVTTYEGIHNHPCEKLMETLSPLLRQLQFLSRF